VSDSVTAEDEEYTENQIKAFNFACESVKKEGINPGLRHCSSSAALLNLSGAHFDMVRAGIILYGYYPDQVTKKYLAEKGINVELKKVMSMTTKVVSVRPLKKGKSVSYGHTWTTPEDTELAVLPVGYADGLLRSFARTLKVKIGSNFYEIRGRICMDQCMVEIGKNSGVKRWDDVVLFGDNDCTGCENLVSAQELAETTNTIPYEILTGITKRVPRVYI
nr:alanine racemase [Treponema sp.]